MAKRTYLGIYNYQFKVIKVTISDTLSWKHTLFGIKKGNYV